MKNLILRLFQILAIILLAFLALSTFMPVSESPGFLFLNRFYDSPLNLALWSLLALILVFAVLFKGIRSTKQKILHLSLAVIIVLFIVDKSQNERFFITIREGETINLAQHIDNHKTLIHLDRFEIDLHGDEETPKAYRSYLTLDSDTKALLEVNKPLAIGKYRLYQSAFEQNYYFSLKIDDKEFELTFGDSLETGFGTIVLTDYDDRIRHFRVIVNDKVQWLPLNTGVSLDDAYWSITPLEERYSSTIEVVEVRGLFWLLVAGIIYLLVMAVDFWKPSKKRKEA